jgi:2-polyprenyl-3-methyl-5-hydroxy-6-metoxy-1,4-benzoquinol methylase
VSRARCNYHHHVENEVIAKPERHTSCLFCKGAASYIYHMGGYPIYQCFSCGTGFVCPMPEQESINKLYEGFIPNLNENQMPTFKNIASELFTQLGLGSGINLKMLDIGGGNGFFCKAFEELGYGQGTYVDLDAQSCRFAREQLHLTRVIPCDAIDLRKYTDEKFDFIYCRHVIEHLVNPTAFILTIFEFLGDQGIFVVQFPNGDSLEFLAYPHRNIGYRFNRIRASSNQSIIKTLWIMISGGILHGMDPPRHLWAISRKGIQEWSNENRILCETFSRHMGDIPFAHGISKNNTIARKLTDFMGQRMLSPIYGGAHLVAILKKETQPIKMDKREEMNLTISNRRRGGSRD